MKTFLIIPAFNEQKNIFNVIEEAKKHAKNIIAIDDGSKDETYNEAKKTGITVLRHAINLGKGAALKTGSEYAIKKGAEAMIYMDSDGQHAPKDIPRIASELEGKDIVFTYRNLGSIHMPLVKKAGNLFLNTLLKTLFKISIKDTQCGYKALTTDTYRKLKLMSNDYNIESEIVAKTGKYRMRLSQIPIETIYTDKYKGTTILDGIGIAMRMLWWKIGK